MHKGIYLIMFNDKYEFTKEDTRLYKIQIHIQRDISHQM